MGTIRLATDDVPDRQRFEYWQDWVCRSFVNLDCNAPLTRHFSGQIFQQSLADLSIVSMTSDKMSLHRSHDLISKAREDEFLLPFETQRRSYTQQDGREAVLESGDFVLIDSTRPYEVKFEAGFQHTVLKVPRKHLIARLGPVECVSGLRISGTTGLGRLVSNFVRTLPKALDALNPYAASRVAETLVDLLTVALGEVGQELQVCDTANQTSWSLRIRNFIEANLTDADLDPELVSKALRISPRYINRILAREGTAAGRYIWERRLHKCFALLSDPSQAHRSISEIAFAYGFNDTSHFSRTFKARYGMTPRELRASKAAN